LKAALLEAFARTAWAEIVSAELFRKFLVAVDDSHSSSDLSFGRESPPPFAHRLEKNGWLWKLLDRMGHLLLIKYVSEGHRKRKNGSETGHSLLR
jgi:hypothetical protein